MKKKHPVQQFDTAGEFKPIRGLWLVRSLGWALGHAALYGEDLGSQGHSCLPHDMISGDGIILK